VGKRLAEGASEVAIVEPDYREAGQSMEASFTELLSLRETSSQGRLVAYLCTENCRDQWMGYLRELHLPLVIVRGVDDNRLSILRVLARAEILRGLPEDLSMGLGSSGRRGEFDSILSCTIGWPPPETPSQLAWRLHVSPRTLRRRFARLGMVAPHRFLRWIRLMEAAGLARMGIRSHAALASVLGMRESRDVGRLFLELTGRSLDSHLAEDGGKTLNLLFLSNLNTGVQLSLA